MYFNPPKLRVGVDVFFINFNLTLGFYNSIKVDNICSREVKIFEVQARIQAQYKSCGPYGFKAKAFRIYAEGQKLGRRRYILCKKSVF